MHGHTRRTTRALHRKDAPLCASRIRTPHNLRRTGGARGRKCMREGRRRITDRGTRAQPHARPSYGRLQRLRLTRTHTAAPRGAHATAPLRRRLRKPLLPPLQPPTPTTDADIGGAAAAVASKPTIIQAYCGMAPSSGWNFCNCCQMSFRKSVSVTPCSSKVKSKTDALGSSLTLCNARKYSCSSA